MGWREGPGGKTLSSCHVVILGVFLLGLVLKEKVRLSQFSGPSLNRIISLVVNRIVRQTHLATIHNPKRGPNLEGSLRAMISQARIHSSAHGGSSVCVVVVTRRTEHPPTVMRGQMSGWRTVSVWREVSTRGSLSVQGVLVGTV